MADPRQATLFVEWTRPGPAWPAQLFEPQLTVTQGDGAVIPAGPRPNQFTLPENGPVTVELILRGRDPSAHAGGGKPVLFSAVERYQVVNNRITIPGRPHPLVDTAFVADTWLTACLAHFHAEVIDFSHYWYDVEGAARGNGATYAEDSAAEDPGGAGSRLVCLGHTTAAPPLWFVTIPGAARDSATGKVSCLVFFRPNNYAYNSPFQTATHDMYPLNRYLLAPRDAGSRDGPYAASRVNKDCFFLRVGMEQALRRSGLPLVLLSPWPSEGDFGAASTSRLPELAQQLLWYLGAAGLLAVGQEDVVLDRLGIAGYSAGGAGMKGALRSNLDRVSEVYLFDVTTLSLMTGDLEAWAARTPGARLRLNVTRKWDIANALIRKIHASLERQGRAAHKAHFSVWPQCDSAQEMEARWSSNPWWQYTIADSPPGPADLGAFRHQFVMHGGQQRDISWLEAFLATSGFPRG